MIFVDTSAWFAVWVPTDSNHRAATQFLRFNRERLTTTDYVLDETLTVLRFRGEYQRAISLGKRLIGEQEAFLQWVQPTDVVNAYAVFRTFQDKSWSFTDCVCRVVMERLSIVKAFAFDDHFRQFGTVTVVP